MIQPTMIQPLNLLIKARLSLSMLSQIHWVYSLVTITLDGMTPTLTNTLMNTYSVCITTCNLSLMDYENAASWLRFLLHDSNQ